MMNKILNFYFLLPHDSTFGIFSKILNRIAARFFKRILDYFVPAYFLKTQHLFYNCLNTSPRERKVIISLTSFPARIDDAWIVIECLFRQTYKADRIILWLSESQFEGIPIPKSLLNQKHRGLEIKFVKDDFKAHKKYLYAFDNNEDNYIVTVDDDLYYDQNLLRNLIELKAKYPNSVPSNRAHKISLKKNGDIKKYFQWNHNYTSNIPSYLLVQTGGFGTLYSRTDLDSSYNNTQIIKEVIPYADDLWMKVQTLLANKKVVTNEKYNKDPLTIKKSQMEKLVKRNVIDGGNDKQFLALLDFFNLGKLEKYRNI
ncbi:MAG: hypothetical protein K9H61_02935 [Bacteroidia bacterium]|nr:hypothetical protein [Bacteroidia bacterium]MCF8445927.1 hypothetical protein [Bacteroidia bacterium]